MVSRLQKLLRSAAISIWHCLSLCICLPSLIHEICTTKYSATSHSQTTIMNIIQATVGATRLWSWRGRVVGMAVSPPQRATDRGEDNFSFDWRLQCLLGGMVPKSPKWLHLWWAGLGVSSSLLLLTTYSSWALLCPPLIARSQLNSQLNLLMYGSCEAGLNKHREHIIKHKA